MVVFPVPEAPDRIKVTHFFFPTGEFMTEREVVYQIISKDGLANYLFSSLNILQLFSDFFQVAFDFNDPL